jgi:hypothetical protein
VGEAQGNRGISRRDLIKGAAAAGGVIWVAPTLFASPAGAVQTTGCANCPPGQTFGLKFENNPQGGGNACTCQGISGAGSCLSTGLPSGCCLIDAGLITPPTNQCGPDSTSHTYILQQGVQFCQGAAKSGQECNIGGSNVIVVNNPDGTTTVTITDTTPPALSHSEIIVCVLGTLPSECAN